MGRLTEYFGRLNRQTGHGRHGYLDTGGTVGGSYPATKLGPLQKGWSPEGLPKREARAGKFVQLLVQMNKLHADGDLRTFKQVGRQLRRVADQLDGRGFGTMILQHKWPGIYGEPHPDE